MFVTLILLERFAFLQLYRICASKFLFYFILLNISKMYLVLVNYSVSSSSIASFLFCFNAANKSKNTSFSLFVVLPLLIWSVHKSGPYNGASITTCHRFKLWKKKMILVLLLQCWNLNFYAIIMHVATRLLLYQASMIRTQVSSSCVPLTNEQNRIQVLKQLIWFISRHFQVAQFDILFKVVTGRTWHSWSSLL